MIPVTLGSERQRKLLDWFHGWKMAYNNCDTLGIRELDAQNTGGHDGSRVSNRLRTKAVLQLETLQSANERERGGRSGGGRRWGPDDKGGDYIHQREWGNTDQK